MLLDASLGKMFARLLFQDGARLKLEKLVLVGANIFT